MLLLCKSRREGGNGPMEDEMTLEGSVEDIIFYNDDNGYSVFEFTSEDGKKNSR